MRRVSTYVNAGAPVAVVAVLLLGGDEVVFSTVLGIVLVVDVCAYVWMSRLGVPLSTRSHVTED